MQEEKTVSNKVLHLKRNSTGWLVNLEFSFDNWKLVNMRREIQKGGIQNVCGLSGLFWWQNIQHSNASSSIFVGVTEETQRGRHEIATGTSIYVMILKIWPLCVVTLKRSIWQWSKLDRPSKCISVILSVHIIVISLTATKPKFHVKRDNALSNELYQPTPPLSSHLSTNFQRIFD